MCQLHFSAISSIRDSNFGILGFGFWGTGHENVLITNKVGLKLESFSALNEAFPPQNGTPKKLIRNRR
jgi:hypothetical protein